jgi:hypothetical protein
MGRLRVREREREGGQLSRREHTRKSEREIGRQKR